MIAIDKIKELREATGVSITECKKALELARGDIGRAKEVLKEWGKDIAGRKMSRQAHQGIIDSYIHPDRKVGVLLELGCETDFAAKAEDFKTLAHELCLQIAAMGQDPPLSEQAWIKDQSQTVNDLISKYIAKVGENIVVKRFIRYEI